MLRPHVVRRWKALAGAGGATVALTLADLAKPWPLALVVDQAARPPGAVHARRRRLRGCSPPSPRSCSLIALVEAGAQYASDLWLQAAGERISHDLRVRVYDHLQRLSLGFHQQRQKGDLVTRVTGDVNAMGDLFSQSLGAMVQAALLSLGMTVVLLVIDPVLALVVARHRAAAARSATSTGAACAAGARAARAGGPHRVDRRRGAVGDGGRQGVRLRGLREQSACARGQRAAAGRPGVEVARLQARFDGLVGSVRAISTALVLVIGASASSHGAISAGELLVFAATRARPRARCAASRAR